MPGKKKQGNKEHAFDEDFSFWVHAKPRSRNNAIVGWDKDGFLEVHLKAIPERGEANRNCCRELSRALNIPPSRIILEKGHTSPHKRFRIKGLSKEKGKRLLAETGGLGKDRNSS